MSDTHDKSDDLIAELAKLMASGASAGEGAPKPAVIKLPPLSDATVVATPVRIPGMEPPGAARAPASTPPRDKPMPPVTAAPAVRIPGMERPAGVSDGLPTAPAPRPGAQFDFGRPAAPAPSTPGPTTSWQNRDVPKPVPVPPVTAAPLVQSPAAAAPSAPPPIPGLRIDPVRFQASPPPPPPAMPEARAAASEPVALPKAQVVAPKPEAPAKAADDSFDFNFGFDSDDAEPRRAADDHEHDDPIADLIAAELLDGNAASDEDSDDIEDEADEPIVAAPPVREPPPQAAIVPPIQMRPNAVSPRQPETDRFAPATSFTARSTPAHVPVVAERADTAARRGEPDPMDEIESLIGEAVRVELDPPATQTKPAAPVVPPLNTGFAPRRSGLRDREPDVESAEAAIFAAAAASGTDVEMVEEAEPEERPYKRMKVKPPRTSGVPAGMRQYVGIAVAGTLLLAAGFGLYWVLGMGDGGDPATAPVLTADVSPVKVEPAAPAAASEPVSGSVVFDEIDGVAGTGENEALVSRDETEGATVSEVARAVTPAAAEDNGTGDTGLANRKVRTVTVRPDGTIVSSDDAVAGTAELPVDRPNVPEIPGATTEPPDLLTAVAEAQNAAGASASNAVAAASDNVSALVAGGLDGAQAELNTPDPIEVAALPAGPTSDTPAVFDGSLVAPQPMPRPFDRSGLVGGGRTASVEQPAPVNIGANPPASTPLTSVQQPAQQPAATSRGGAYVQLSSQRTEGDANASLRAVQSRLGGLLSTGLEVRRVDLGAKGIWYRVVMPANSFREATQSCATIKANGGDCVAING